MNAYMYMCTIEIDVAMHNANAAAWLFVLFWVFFFDKHDDVFKNLKTTKNFDYILIINIHVMQVF